MKFDEVLRTFSGFFEREGLRHTLIGGLAMQAWGRSRLTKDIDFAVDGSARDRVIAYAESLGYETLHASEAYSNHAHTDPSWGRIDFMYLYGDTAERSSPRRERSPSLAMPHFQWPAQNTSR